MKKTVEDKLLLTIKQLILNPKIYVTVAVIIDQTLIDTLNIFSSDVVAMSTINVSIEGVSYYCNSFISISNKNYYILKI